MFLPKGASIAPSCNFCNQKKVLQAEKKYRPTQEERNARENNILKFLKKTLKNDVDLAHPTKSKEKIDQILKIKKVLQAENPIDQTKEERRNVEEQNVIYNSFKETIRTPEHRSSNP